MNMIIVGCGRVGSELAYRLFQGGHQVTVVDNNELSFERLNPNFHGRTVTGELLSKEVFERAGIEAADGLAAVTNSDTLNAVIAHTARSIYHTPNVIVRNYDPNLRVVLEAFGFQIVSSTSWGAQRIEEMLCSAPAHAVYSTGNGEVEIYEVIIPSSWNGRKLDELFISSEHSLPVAYSHAGKSSLPNPDMILDANDILYVSATAEGITSLRSRMEAKEV